MTMSGYNCVAHVLDVGEQIGNQLTVFFGNGIADRIGDVDSTGSGVNNRRYHFHQIFFVRACGVHR